MVKKNTADHNKTVAYYKGYFDEVSLITCDKCKSKLALQVSGAKPHLGGEVPAVAVDALGNGIVTLGDQMLSRRVRLDEHADGPMMGYECKCGNDTRLSKAELHHQPHEGWAQKDLQPHEAAQIRRDIKDCDHDADYSRSGAVTRYETFHVEVLA